jgi:hypothetical protein
MDTDLLYAIAEVAVAFAGFSGIAVVLRRSAPGGLSPHARRTLWYLVIDCLVVLFAAFLPVVLQQFGVGVARLWAVSNAVLGLAHLVLVSPAVLWFVRSPDQIRAEWQPVVSPIQASLMLWSILLGVVQVLAALGVGVVASPGLFTLSLLAFLLFAAVDFVFLVAGEDAE